MILLDVFMTEAIWEKLWLLLILIAAIARYDSFKSFWTDTYGVLLLLTCLGLIGQALVTRVTSPLPTDYMTYFHAFGFAAVASLIHVEKLVQWAAAFVIACGALLLMFSDGYWKYISPTLGIDRTKSNPNDTIVYEPWVKTTLRGFEGVTMPQSTVDGMNRLVQSEVAKKKDLRVLNMSELTPLALSMNYTPQVNQPLWYHLHVGIFDREVELLCQRVSHKEYDVVLFEDIPSLNNFYPYQIRDTLQKYYHMSDKFMAPRKLQDSWVEVYTIPSDSVNNEQYEHE